jgi:hypothetical protein
MIITRIRKEMMRECDCCEGKKPSIMTTNSSNNFFGSKDDQFLLKHGRIPGFK